MLIKVLGTISTVGAACLCVVIGWQRLDAAPGSHAISQAQVVGSLAGLWSPADRHPREYFGSWATTMVLAAVDISKDASSLSLLYQSTGFVARETIPLDGQKHSGVVQLEARPDVREERVLVVVSSTAEATVRGNEITVDGTIVVGEPLGTSSVSITDKFALASDGTLTDEHAAGEVGPYRESLSRSVDGVIHDVPNLHVANMQSGADHEWFGGYRFGMTSDQVRKVDACPGKDYRGTSPLRCEQFPFEDARVTLEFDFNNNDHLQVIRLSDGPGNLSEASATRLFTSVFNLLDREFGGLASVELGDKPVTVDSVFGDLNARSKPLNRYGEELTVVTAHRFDSVLALANVVMNKPDWTVSMELASIQANLERLAPER